MRYNYSYCVDIIQKNKSKPQISKAIQELYRWEQKTEDIEIKKNIRNWIRIGKARLTPNKLSSIMITNESEIRDFLFDNPKRIEDKLEMICKEFDLGIGRIDLLAKDKCGQYVIIEIKQGSAIGQAVGQLLSYLFAFKFYFNKEARGILLASKFHAQAIGAFEFIKGLGAKNIELKYLNGNNMIFDPKKFQRTRKREVSLKNKTIWKEIAL